MLVKPLHALIEQRSNVIRVSGRTIFVKLTQL